MAKVIQIDEKKDSLIKYLKKILTMAENGEISKILIASFMDNSEPENGACTKEVMTGFYGLDVFEMQYLVSVLQVDVNFKVVEANIDKLIE